MLDLNINFTDITNTKSMEVEDSGTSNSSVVNANEAPTPGNAGDEDSTNNTTSSFMFDILRREKDGLCISGDGDQTQSLQFVTRPLFPVAGYGRGGKEGADCGLGLSSSSLSTARTHWLNLSFAESGGQTQAELRVVQQKKQPPRKSRRGPRSRSSQYRGVTFYRRTGRWESHIWDCGKQVYLGGFDTAHSAARAYDRAAIKFRGIDADINFNVGDYEEDMKLLGHLNKEEFVHVLRRQTTGASRGKSKYRGVAAAPMPECGAKWEDRMGQVPRIKVFEKEAIKCRTGREAVTNFDPSIYEGEMVLNASVEGTLRNEENVSINRGQEHELVLSPDLQIVSQNSLTHTCASDSSTPRETDNGSGHNLDLSLGISQPCSTGEKRIGKLGDFQFPKERPMVNGFSSAAMGQLPHVLTTVAKCPALYPGFVQRHGEITSDHNRLQPISSPRYTNWASQVYGNSNNVSPMQVFSIAASSGFPSSTATTPPPSASLPPNLQDSSSSAYNLGCLPFPATSNIY